MKRIVPVRPGELSPYSRDLELAYAALDALTEYLDKAEADRAAIMAEDWDDPIEDDSGADTDRFLREWHNPTLRKE